MNNSVVTESGRFGRVRFCRISWPFSFMLILSGIVAGGFIYAVLLFENNCSISHKSRPEFIDRLEHARLAAHDWIMAENAGSREKTRSRRNELFSNLMLLHMVSESAILAGDDELQQYATLDYYFPNGPPKEWLRLLDTNTPVKLPKPEDSAHLEMYQRWFLYALTQGDFPLPPDERDLMFQPDHFHNRELTHQLLALYLYCRFNPSTDDIHCLMDHLDERIAREEMWSVGVDDLYLQRLVCLLITGHDQLVNPRWIERVLANQKTDGGWTWKWHGGYASFCGHIWRTAAHPTAQGLWILYQIKFRHPLWIETHFQ